MSSGSSGLLGLRRRKRRNRRRNGFLGGENSLFAEPNTAINPLPTADRAKAALLFLPRSRQACQAGSPIPHAPFSAEPMFRRRQWDLRYATVALIAAQGAVPDRTPPQGDRRHRGGEPAGRRRLTARPIGLRQPTRGASLCGDGPQIVHLVFVALAALRWAA